METLIDRCRAAKKKQNLSNLKVSELSGVPLSTCNNFFSPGQRSPCIDTVGPICKALNVSIDLCYGIEPPVRELSEHEQELIQRDLAHEQEKVKILNEFIQQKNRVIYLLFGMCAALSGLLVIYMVVDAQAGSSGLIQAGTPTPAAWLVIIAVVAASGVLFWVLAHVRKNKEVA